LDPTQTFDLKPLVHGGDAVFASEGGDAAIAADGGDA
jgi:hypothetical protein